MDSEPKYGYITKHTFNKINNKITFDTDIFPNINLIKELNLERSFVLKNIFSQKEINKIYDKYIFSKLDLYPNYEQRLKLINFKNNNSNIDNLYIFINDSENLKYHLYKDCKFLNKPFFNITIPSEIIKNKKYLIPEFRNFVKAELGHYFDHELKERYYHSDFQKKLVEKFGINEVDSKTIEKGNSGIQIFNFSALSLNELFDAYFMIYDGDSIDDLTYLNLINKEEKDEFIKIVSIIRQIGDLKKSKQLLDMSLQKSYFAFKEDKELDMDKLIIGLPIESKQYVEFLKLFHKLIKKPIMDKIISSFSENKENETLMKREILEKVGLTLCKECLNHPRPNPTKP